MRIEHDGLWASDLERVRNFYATYCGTVAGEKCTNPIKRFESYFLTLAGGGCPLELKWVADLPANSVVPCSGYAHIAVALGSEPVRPEGRLERRRELRDVAINVRGLLRFCHSLPTFSAPIA